MCLPPKSNASSTASEKGNSAVSSAVENEEAGESNPPNPGTQSRILTFEPSLLAKVPSQCSDGKLARERDCAGSRQRGCASWVRRGRTFHDPLSPQALSWRGALRAAEENRTRRRASVRERRMRTPSWTKLGSRRSEQRDRRQALHPRERILVDGQMI